MVLEVTYKIEDATPRMDGLSVLVTFTATDPDKEISGRYSKGYLFNQEATTEIKKKIEEDAQAITSRYKTAEELLKKE